MARIDAARAQGTVAFRTSSLARMSLVLLVAGYLAFVLLAAVPTSPLTTPLPAQATPPTWSRDLARTIGLGHLDRTGVVVVALLVMLIVLTAFAGVLTEAWRGRVRLRAAMAAAGLSLAVSAAGPLLLSRDAISYAAYARVVTVHHANPYVTAPGAFPHDPFVAVMSHQWFAVRSPYGPLFMAIGSGIARDGVSPGAVIVWFKVLAAVAVAVATGCAAFAARLLRPPRAALACAFVGLNPVLVIHTVGGGHADAIIAALLGGALATVAVVTMRGAARRPPRHGGRKRASPPALLLVTILLACAVAVKVTIIPALVAWLAWLWWAERGDGRLRVIGMHIVATAAVLGGLALIWPGRAEFAALPRQVGIEGWASPAHLVAGIAQTIIGNVAGSRAGRAAGAATIALFLVGYAALFVVMLRRWRRLDGENGLLDGRRAADRWGVTMLLFALCAPCLLPWYAAWFVPFAGLMFDTALVAVAGVASALLALTLIPADPPRGLSSWGVMLGVHYLVAPLMLVLLAVTVSRALRSSRPVVPMAGDGTDAGSRGL